MKKSKMQLITNLVLAMVFLSIGFKVRNSSDGILFDVSLLNYIRENSNDTIFKFMKFISFIGSEMFLFPALGAVIIFMIIKKKYYESKLLILSSLGSWLLNHGLKQIFQRTRPLDFILVKQGGLSYPSGHSMVTMSMYITIAFLLSKKYKDKKIIFYATSLVFILLMGISRMFLGVHWPTDIIGGYIGGYLFFLFYANIIKE